MASQRARTLRNNMSDAESKLWQELSLRQVDGARFRRQHPIGRYIADFICLEKRLIVEVDSEQHTQCAHAARDASRDRWLTAEGYRVMRFQTIEVYEDLDGVVDTIWGALQEMPAVPGPGRSHRSRQESASCLRQLHPHLKRQGLSRLAGARCEGGDGRLSPWRFFLPPLAPEAPPPAQGEEFPRRRR